jgi:hypothetical protein
MTKQNVKAEIIDRAGYAYNFDRMMYINRQAKKAFSIEFVDDHREEDLVSKIQEPNQDADWRIYTSLPMSDGTERELKRVLQ